MMHNAVAWVESETGGGASATCGDPNGEPGTDDGPPTVRIVAPTDGDDFDAGTELEIVVEATDEDDGVAEVRIEIDGDPLPADTTAPYELSATLSDGSHVISAYATDHAGNSSGPQSVTVYLGSDGSGNGGGHGDDGGGDGGADDGGPGSGGADGGGDDGGDGFDPDDASLPPRFGYSGELDGCGCRASSGSRAVGWLALAILGVWLRRRR